MTDLIDLQKFSSEEKFQIMEALWEDVSSNEAEYISPSWHEQVLHETRTRYEAGEEGVVDWGLAKKDLRDKA